MPYDTSSAPNSSRTTPLACRTCGALDTPRIGPGTAIHAFRALCRHCGSFIQWLSLYDLATRLERRQQARQQALEVRPPSQAQLDFLQALGDTGPPPQNMAAASSRIDALKRGEVQP